MTDVTDLRGYQHRGPTIGYLTRRSAGIAVARGLITPDIDIEHAVAVAAAYADPADQQGWGGAGPERADPGRPPPPLERSVALLRM